MNGYEIRSKRKLLKTGFDAAVTDALVDAKDRSLKSSPEEPDFVASLVSELPNKIRKTLSVAFPKDHFEVSGIFCHQKPIVHIGMNKNPELGDLLLVLQIKSGNEDRFNSLLLQAKKTSKTVYKIPSSEYHQLELYTKWPEFTYLRAGILNKTKRNIIPKAATVGAQYLLIKENDISGSNLSVAPAASQLSPVNTFSETLISFLAFTTGRSVESIDNKSTDDWTNMIQDLLRVAKQSSYTRRNSKRIKEPRYNGTTKFMNINEENFVSDGQFDEGDMGLINDGYGPSVIIIQCKEDDKDKENVYEQLEFR